MVKTYSHAKVQQLVSSEDRVETNGWTEGWMDGQSDGGDCITSPSLMRSVIMNVLARFSSTSKIWLDG